MRDATLQFVIELLQALLRLLALGDIGDEAFEDALAFRLEQQVHQHVDGAAIAPAQARLVAEQSLALAQSLANHFQLVEAANEQVPIQIARRPQHLLRVVITEHARHRRIGRQYAVLQAGLDDAVHGVFEQPFIAVALGFQLLQTRQQLGVMTLARRLAAEPQQLGKRFVRAPRHTPPRRHAGSIHADW